MREPSSWLSRGPCRCITRAWCVGPAGVESRARAQSGFPRNQEILSFPSTLSRTEIPGDQLLKTARGSRPPSGEPRPGMDRWREGNEARREERQEVTAP